MPLALRFGLVLLLAAPGALSSASGGEQWPVLIQRGNQAYRANQLAEAEKFFQAALDVLGTSSEDSQRRAVTLDCLGAMNYYQRRYTAAESRYRQALAIWETVPDAGAGLATVLYNLATLYRLEHLYSKSGLLFQRALLIREKVFGESSTEVADTLNELGVVFEAEGRSGEAEVLYLKSLAILEQWFGPGGGELAKPLNNIGRLYIILGRSRDAEDLLRRALRQSEAQSGANAVQAGPALNNLGCIYFAQRRAPEAEDAFRRVLSIYEAAFGPLEPQVAQILRNYADLLRHTGRKREAAKFETRARAIAQISAPSDPSRFIVDVHALRASAKSR